MWKPTFALILFGGLLIGLATCHFSTLYFYKSDRPATGCELEAIEHGLMGLLDSAPRKGQDSYVSAYGCDQAAQAHIRASCPHEPVLCSECIEFAAKEILSLSKHHSGATLKLSECYLRYEMWHFY